MNFTQELEILELGNRVEEWLTICSRVMTYSTKENCEHVMTGVLINQVSEATFHRGLHFPTEWWPTQS